jgi:3-oxoacyl-[acyl-carrier-protein] synthase-3
MNHKFFRQVTIDAFGYELPPNVVTSDDLEERLAPVYERLRFQKGQLEALTGVHERRFWDKGHQMRTGAIAAGQKALYKAQAAPGEIGMLVYAGVCRDHLEPATACAVADGLNLRSATEIFDLSNACLGVLNGMIQVANAIELGQIKAGLIVSCESARQIIDITIQRLVDRPDMALFKKTIATLTGGSGAIAVVLSHREMSPDGHRLLGGVVRSAPRHHELCRWGPDTGIPASGLHFMETDSVEVLKNGVDLGITTYKDFITALDWPPHKPDKIICHQVGAAHQKSILEALSISEDKDFTTYRYLGNMGTVSLPITAAIADERGVLLKGDHVAFLGIGSGLNCLMLGIDW